MYPIYNYYEVRRYNEINYNATVSPHYRNGVNAKFYLYLVEEK